MTVAGPKTAIQSGRAQSDERVLNAGTTQRFVLLIVLFVAEGSSTGYDLIGRVSGLGFDDLGPTPTWVYYAAAMGLAGVASLLYVVLPRLKGRGDGIIQLRSLREPERRVFEYELAHLVERASLAQPVKFEVDLRAPRAGAVVFGTTEKPTVRLNAGLLVLYHARKSRFRAIVLHELAHIHNRDVGITYATVAMWRVLLGGALIPDVAAVLLGLVTGRDQAGAHRLVQEAAVFLLVYVTRADILRTREFYADRTAVHAWHVRAEALLPARIEADDMETGPRRRRQLLADTWRMHPSWARRARSLGEPEELFTVRADTLLATGLAAAIASAQLVEPLQAGGSWVRMVQYLLISGLIMRIGGVAVWRATVRGVLTDRRVPSGWRAGMWLGLGLAAGELVNSLSAARAKPPAQPETLAILVVAVALLMVWTAQFAHFRIATYRGPDLNEAMGIGLAAPWLTLAFVLLWWHYYSVELGWHFSLMSRLSAADLPTDHPPMLLRAAAALTFLPGGEIGVTGFWWAVPLLWLIPLQLWITRLPRRPLLWIIALRLIPEDRLFLNVAAVIVTTLVMFVIFAWSFLSDASGLVDKFICSATAWLAITWMWRASRRGITRKRWLELGQEATPRNLADPPDLRPVLTTGAVGGVVCSLVLFAEPVAGHTVRTLRSWAADTDVDVLWTVLAISTAMAVVAAVVAARETDRYWLLTPVIAAGLTGTMGVVTAYAKGSVDGCLGPMNIMTASCKWEPVRYSPIAEYALGYLFTAGLILSALLAAVIHTLTVAPRRREPAPRRTSDHPAPGASTAVGVAVSLVAAVTLFQMLTMYAPVPPDDLLREYPVPPTGYFHTSNSPLGAWAGFISDTMDKEESAFSDLDSVMKARNGNETHDLGLISKLVPAVCTRLAAIAAIDDQDSWLRAPTVPDEPLQEWRKFISLTRPVVDDCTALAAANSMAGVDANYNALVADAYRAGAHAKAAANWLTAQPPMF